MLHGIRALAVTPIAEKAGISPSTFHRLTGGMEQLRIDFWAWCWKELNTYLAEQVYNDGRRPDGARTALLWEFDHFWALDENDRMRSIAFLCFVYFRRENEVADGIPHLDGQQRFENRILRLCEAAVTETESQTDPQVLQIMTMNWAATVLMSWQYFDGTKLQYDADRARLVLSSIVDTELANKAGRHTSH